MKTRTKGIWAGIVIGAVLVAVIILISVGAGGPRLLFASVQRGGISREIVTSGTLKPLTDVDVGTDVSGKIVKVNADFNSRVRKGQVLAEIDPAPFQDDVKGKDASVQEARAALGQARVNLEAAKKKYDRTLDQFNRKMVSQEDMETDKAAFDSARDDVREAESALKLAQSQLEESRVNLSHTRIVAPIDGIVVTRTAEAGQTVASRMETPILFEIADDLTRLNLECDVDEVDVGVVKVGETVVFTVPAFQDARFSGKISEIREGAENVDGAVIYKTLVLVDNPDLRLLPGMTAAVTVFAAALQNVLEVPNAALKFKPPADALAPKAVVPHPDRKRGEAVIWVPGAGKKLEPRLVTRGITDLKNTAIVGGDLQEGQQVAVGLKSSAKK
jgi:HlyD family secretion protein